jgi:uncharacterized protein YecE (DUF72 family)
MNILVGTASWTDKTLIECGRFYPKGCNKPEARLRYYASQFPMVEIDSSYYAIPALSVSRNWALRTPPDFVFNIKAFRTFTGHQTSPSVLSKDIQAALGDLAQKRMLYYKDFPSEILDELWRRFIDAVAPLKNAGKLGAVHFQFAPWILRNRDGHAHVRECVDRMAGHQLAVEFRNATWFAEEHIPATLEFEHELGVSHTVVDGPQGFSSSVPAVWEATNTKLAVVRLHGRNAATWNVKGQTAASDRFNYDYPESELTAMVASIRRLAARVDLLEVIFNNNQEDQGQRNAKTLMKLLDDAV